MPKKNIESSSGRTRAKPARRARLDRATVLDMALAQADEGGIESLSMRKLALSLGVEAMSLYNHVAHKLSLIHISEPTRPY